MTDTDYIFTDELMWYYIQVSPQNNNLKDNGYDETGSAARW